MKKKMVTVLLTLVVAASSILGGCGEPQETGGRAKGTERTRESEETKESQESRETEDDAGDTSRIESDILGYIRNSKYYEYFPELNLDRCVGYYSNGNKYPEDRQYPPANVTYEQLRNMFNIDYARANPAEDSPVTFFPIISAIYDDRYRVIGYNYDEEKQKEYYTTVFNYLDSIDKDWKRNMSLLEGALLLAEKYPKVLKSYYGLGTELTLLGNGIDSTGIKFYDFLVLNDLLIDDFIDSSINVSRNDKYRTYFETDLDEAGQRGRGWFSQATNRSCSYYEYSAMHDLMTKIIEVQDERDEYIDAHYSDADFDYEALRSACDAREEELIREILPKYGLDYLVDYCIRSHNAGKANNGENRGYLK